MLRVRVDADQNNTTTGPFEKKKNTKDLLYHYLVLHNTFENKKIRVEEWVCITNILKIEVH